MTHEFIAQMLGIRRAGVSENAAALQERNLIKCGRASLQVIDEVGLQAASCECFLVILEEYDRLLGPAIKQHGGSLGISVSRNPPRWDSDRFT